MSQHLPYLIKGLPMPTWFHPWGYKMIVRSVFENVFMLSNKPASVDISRNSGANKDKYPWLISWEIYHIEIGHSGFSQGNSAITTDEIKALFALDKLSNLNSPRLKITVEVDLALIEIEEVGMRQGPYLKFTTNEHRYEGVSIALDAGGPNKGDVNQEYYKGVPLNVVETSGSDEDFTRRRLLEFIEGQ